MLAPPGSVELDPPIVREGVDELPLDVADLLVSDVLEVAGELVDVADLLVTVDDELEEELAAGVLVVLLDLLVAVLEEFEFELLLEEDEAGLETLDPPDVLVPPDVLTSPDVAVLPDVLELVVLATELDVPLVLLLLTSEELEDDVLVVVVFCVAVLLSVVLEEDLRVCAFAEFVASISTMLIASAVVRYFFIVPWICCNSLFKIRTKVIRSRG